MTINTCSVGKAGCFFYSVALLQQNYDWKRCNIYAGKFFVGPMSFPENRVQALTNLFQLKFNRHTVILEYFNIKEEALSNFAFHSF